MSSQLAVDPTAPSDAELIARVRGGDGHAYGQLFERHRDAALRLGRQLGPAADADDLVSDAFIKVLRVLTEGGGPDVSFRPYLLTAVRRLHIDRLRSSSRVSPSDEMDKFDPGVPFTDPAVSDFENSAAAMAFASLPERWQMVLWHLEVEGQRPADIAPLLGMSANSVSALAYRAREGLRQAYLQNHLADTGDETCRWVTERLGAHVRGGLAKREAAKVDEHLDECPRCAAVYLELTEVNSNLRALIAPLLLGGAAAGYLASTGSAAAAGGLFGLWWLRLKDTVTANSGLSASVAASTVVVVGVATAMIVQGPDNGREPVSGIALSSPPIASTGPSASTDPAATDPGGPSASTPPPDQPPPGQPPANFPFGPAALPIDGAPTPTAGIGPTLVPASLLPPTSPPAELPTTIPTTEVPSFTEPTTEPTEPTETTPSETTPSETTPTETTPTETTPTETTPTETTPTETTPTETTPTETTPTETTPTETTPTETTPTETTPTETTPTETTPTETTPPPPPPADLSMVLEGTRAGPIFQYAMVATVGGVPDGVTPTVTFVFTRTSGPEFEPGGWTCVRTDTDGNWRRRWECFQVDPADDTIRFEVNLLEPISSISAEVDADVDDPNPDNNVDRFPR